MTDNEKPEQSPTVGDEQLEISPTVGDEQLEISPTVGDEKPEELTPSSHILIKIKGQDESEVLCRIRRSAPLKLFMDQYCEKRSMDMNTIQFLFDEKLLKGVQTAEEVGLDDGDEVDAMLHQHGGAAT